MGRRSFLLAGMLVFLCPVPSEYGSPGPSKAMATASASTGQPTLTRIDVRLVRWAGDSPAGRHSASAAPKRIRFRREVTCTAGRGRGDGVASFNRVIARCEIRLETFFESRKAAMAAAHLTRYSSKAIFTLEF